MISYITSTIQSVLREFEEKTDFSFKDLVEIEAKRRELLKVAKEFNGNSIIFAFTGTLLPEVFVSPIFIIVFVFYTILRCLIIYGAVERTEFPMMTAASVASISAFLSFFLVFFVGQTYSRFTTIYNTTVLMQARIYNTALLARISLPTNEAWRLMRYMNAAHLVGYVGLSPVYNDANFFDPMNDQLQLLTPGEVLRVKEIGTDNGGNACRELIGWCLEIVYHHFHQDLVDIYTLEKMVNEILQLRGETGIVYSYDDQPIPFVYVHLLTFLTYIYLPLLTYSIAIVVDDDLQGVLILFLTSVFVLGLVAIGRALGDPFGNDTMDFSVMHYVNSTMLNTRRLMTGRLLVGEGLEVEQELESKRKAPTGSGYTKNQMKATLYTPIKENAGSEKPLLRRGDSHYITFGSFHNNDSINGGSRDENDSNMQQALLNSGSQKIRKRLSVGSENNNNVMLSPPGVEPYDNGLKRNDQHNFINNRNHHYDNYNQHNNINNNNNSNTANSTSINTQNNTPYNNNNYNNINNSREESRSSEPPPLPVVLHTIADKNSTFLTGDPDTSVSIKQPPPTNNNNKNNNNINNANNTNKILIPPVNKKSRPVSAPVTNINNNANNIKHHHNNNNNNSSSNQQDDNEQSNQHTKNTTKPRHHSLDYHTSHNNINKFKIQEEHDDEIDLERGGGESLELFLENNNEHPNTTTPLVSSSSSSPSIYNTKFKPVSEHEMMKISTKKFSSESIIKDRSVFGVVTLSPNGKYKVLPI